MAEYVEGADIGSSTHGSCLLDTMVSGSCRCCAEELDDVDGAHSAGRSLCGRSSLGRGFRVMQKCEQDALMWCYILYLCTLCHCWLSQYCTMQRIERSLSDQRRDPLFPPLACVSASVAVDSQSRRLPPFQLRQCHLSINT